MKSNELFDDGLKYLSESIEKLQNLKHLNLSLRQ